MDLLQQAGESLAASDAASLRWRQDFIRTYLEREAFQFAPRAATETLLSHPVVGTSWETWVTENLLALAPRDAQASFFRSSAGAEIDLLIDRPNGERWAIEIQRSLSPKLERGFHAACADVQPTQQWGVYPGTERYRLGEHAWAVGLPELAAGLRTVQG